MRTSKTGAFQPRFLHSSLHKPGEMVLPGCLEDNRPKYGVFHCTTRERLDIDATTNERIGDSNLTVKYHLEYDDNCEIMLRIESTNIIRSPALVVESKPGVFESISNSEDQEVRMLLDRRDFWGSKFY